MAHELDFYEDEQGEQVAAVISVRQTMWHRHGHVLEVAPATVEEGMEQAHILWEVEKVPVYVEQAQDVLVGEPGPAQLWKRELTYERTPSGYAVRRLDNGEVIADNVGAIWHPLQNLEAFKPLQVALDDGLATIETAGAIREGRDVWMLLRLDVDAVLRHAHRQARTLEDPALAELVEQMFAEIAPYILSTNNHYGAKARIKETAVRVCCANTHELAMQANEGISIEVSHTTNVARAYRVATEAMFDGVTTRFVDFASVRERLRQQRLSDLAHRRLVLNQVAPIVHLENKVGRKEATGATRWALEQAHIKRNRLRELWFNGTEHQGDGSAWEAFQGMVEGLDHDEFWQPRKQGVSRVQSQLVGELGRTKRRVLGYLDRYSRLGDVLQRETGEQGDMLAEMAGVRVG